MQIVNSIYLLLNYLYYQITHQNLTKMDIKIVLSIFSKLIQINANTY